MTLLLTGRKMPAQSTLGTIAYLVWLFSYVTEKQSNSAHLQGKEWSVAGKVHSEKVDKSKNMFSTATFKFWCQTEMITHSGGFWLADPSSGGVRLADPSFVHHALCVQLQFGCTENSISKLSWLRKCLWLKSSIFTSFMLFRWKQCSVKLESNYCHLGGFRSSAGSGLLHRQWWENCMFSWMARFKIWSSQLLLLSVLEKGTQPKGFLSENSAVWNVDVCVTHRTGPCAELVTHAECERAGTGGVLHSSYPVPTAFSQGEVEANAFCLRARSGWLARVRIGLDERGANRFGIRSFTAGTPEDR